MDLKPWSYAIGLVLGFSLALALVFANDAVMRGESGGGIGAYCFANALLIIAVAINLYDGVAVARSIMAPLLPHELLVKHLESKGVTGADLAFRAGISLQEMRLVLGGSTKIAPAFSKRISAVLGTPPEAWSDAQRDFDARGAP